MKKWFNTWFNTPYYHLLYQNRNSEEAEFFLDNLLEYFDRKDIFLGLDTEEDLKLLRKIYENLGKYAMFEDQ